MSYSEKSVKVKLMTDYNFTEDDSTELYNLVNSYDYMSKLYTDYESVLKRIASKYNVCFTLAHHKKNPLLIGINNKKRSSYLFSELTIRLRHIKKFNNINNVFIGNMLL